MQKMFVGPEGEKIGGTGDDHADIARKYLSAIGVSSRDYADLYSQMFRVGFARVIVSSSEIEFEFPSELLPGHLQFLSEARLSGKKVVFQGELRDRIE